MRVAWAETASVVVHGEGEGQLRSDDRNLMYRAAARLLDETGHGDRRLHIESWQEVPLSRGLGSSSCAIVGGLFAANALLGYPAPPQRLLELATELEGHPDNVAAALMGGMTIAVRDGDRVYAAQTPVPEDLQCVVFIPERPLATKRAREVSGAGGEPRRRRLQHRPSGPARGELRAQPTGVPGHRHPGPAPPTGAPARVPRDEGPLRQRAQGGERAACSSPAPGRRSWR